MSKLATRGSGNKSAKLNEPLVKAIRVAVSLGVRQNLLARACGISRTQMWRIVHHVDWKHVSAD